MKHLLLFVILLGFATPAFAEELTEESVKTLYNDIAAIYNAPKIDVPKAMSYMRKHYAPDSQYKINMSANTFPEPQTLVFGKKEMIDSSSQTLSSLTNSQMLIDFTKTQISEEKDKAIVTYNVRLNGQVQQTAINNQIITVDYDAVSSCKDLLAQEQGVIMVSRSVCNMNAQYGQAH